MRERIDDEDILNYVKDIQEQTLASLYIKDSDTAALVSRVAKRSGMTKTALVRELARAREAELDRGERRVSSRERLERFWREHPLPPPTGLKADKAFFDELSGGL